MTNSDRIEAYFNNELPEAEKQQLLKDVNSDPSLQSEFNFQKDVVDGIKAYRKKELISRLDKVQVAATGQSVLLKTLGAIGIAGIATVSTYMWVNRDSSKYIAADESDKIEEVITQPIEQIKPLDNADDLSTNEIIEEEVSSPDKEINLTNVEKTKEPKVTVPNIITPEVLEPDSGQDALAEDNLEAPQAMSSSEVTLKTTTNVEVVFSKKYNFHYRVKDAQLTLYGDFEDAPFEVLEMKTNKGIQSYLFYQENFYGLNNNSGNIEPLQKIQNNNLIKELQKRR